MTKKGILLVSGGIDSPVAGHVMMEQGWELIALHLDNRPFTDDKYIDKALALVQKLEEISGRKIKTYLVPHGETQYEFAKHCRRQLGCVLCRRMMFRLGELIAKREGAVALITGESLGQVASQTLANIKAEDEASGTIPVLRPLIGMDKEEIIDIAKGIGTFDVSIRPGLCCTIVPEKPAVNASLGESLSEEAKVDMDALIKHALDNLQVL